MYPPLLDPRPKVGIGNHEYDHLTGGKNDPSGAPVPAGFYPAWGNYGDDSSGECGVPMFQRYTMPGSGNALFWYAYNFAIVATVVLSSEHNCGPDSAQFAWLEATFAAVNRSLTPWLVIEIHRPLYNSEAYKGDYDTGVGLQGCWEEAFVGAGVDLVITGHYHSYLRSMKIYKDVTDEDKGIYHFTIGSAGASVDVAPLYVRPCFHTCP